MRRRSGSSARRGARRPVLFGNGWRRREVWGVRPAGAGGHREAARKARTGGAGEQHRTCARDDGRGGRPSWPLAAQGLAAARARDRAARPPASGRRGTTSSSPAGRAAAAPWQDAARANGEPRQPFGARPGDRWGALAAGRRATRWRGRSAGTAAIAAPLTRRFACPPPAFAVAGSTALNLPRQARGGAASFARAARLAESHAKL